MTKSPFDAKKTPLVFSTNDVSIVSTDSIAKNGAFYFFGAQASANFAYFAASAAFFSAFDIVARFA